MKNLLIEILNSLKRSNTIVIISVIVFALGLLLGVFITLPTDILDVFSSQSITYYTNVLCLEFSPISLLISKTLSLALLLLVVGLFCLNKYTIYLNLIILFYRGYILGVVLKVFLSNLLIIGAILFLFLILIEAIFLLLSIIIFISIMQDACEKSFNLIFQRGVKCYILCLSIAIIGAILEFLFIVMLFRPLNFFF